MQKPRVHSDAVDFEIDSLNKISQFLDRFIETVKIFIMDHWSCTKARAM